MADPPWYGRSAFGGQARPNRPWFGQGFVRTLTPAQPRSELLVSTGEEMKKKRIEERKARNDLADKCRFLHNIFFIFALAFVLIQILWRLGGTSCPTA